MKFDETIISQRTSCRTVSFLATQVVSSFPNACMVYKHAVAAAFHIYAQGDEVPAKRVGWRPCIK